MFPQQATVPDSIRNTLSRVGGKTVVIHNPGEFAKAIDRVEKVPRLTVSGIAGGGEK